jgi:uncharacterized protein involved in exopolysaccharide biosynthesis
MYNLIENQTKSLMLANARDEYAFVVVDPAVPPEKRVRPQRALIVAVGLLLGFALSLVVVFVRESLRQSHGASQTQR